MRPRLGGRQHHPYHRHGRAAAGRAGAGQGHLARGLAGLTRKRCVHALRVARPGPAQQRRTSLVLRTKVPHRQGGSRSRAALFGSRSFTLGRLSRPAVGSVGSKSNGYTQTTCAGARKGRRDRAAPDHGGTDSYGQLGRRLMCPNCLSRAQWLSLQLITGNTWMAMAPEDVYPVQWAGRQALVALPEHVDVSNAGQIREELLAVINRGAEALIVDMTATLSCDHAGADAVARAYQRAVVSRTELRLVVTSGVVLRMLGMTGVGRLVPVYPSVESALAARSAGRSARAPRSRWRTRATPGAVGEGGCPAPRRPAASRPIRTSAWRSRCWTATA